MNEKLYVALGSVLILLHGFSPIAQAENKDSHAGGTPEAAATASRATVKAQLPEQYESLMQFLKPEKLKVDGFKAHVQMLGKDQAEDRQVGIKDADSLLKWVNTFANYRKGLASCETSMDDKSSQLLGAVLDKFMSELNHITAAKAPEWKVSERKILAYIVEIERFLKEKAEKHAAEAKDFAKADDALKTQLEKTAAVLFGEYHGARLDIAAEIRKDEAALEQAKVDETAKPKSESTSAVDTIIGALIRGGRSSSSTEAKKPVATADVKMIHEEMDKAIAALKMRTGKACMVALEGSTAATTQEKPAADKDKDKDKEKKDDKKTTDKVSDTTKKETPNLTPGPLAGNKTTPPPTGGTPPPTGGTPPPPGGDLPPPTGGTPPPPTGGTPPPPVADPGFNANPGLGSQLFDPTGLLAQLQQQADLARQQADQQLRQFGDLFNLLAQQQADAQRQALQALADQNKENDDTAALLAKALGDKQEPTVIPPPSQFPPITPPSISSGGDQPQPQQPFQEPPPQLPPPVNPLLGQMPQPPSPTPYYPPEKNRFDDFAYQPNAALIAAAAVPRVDPFTQMMQQFMMQQWLQQQQGMNPRMANVNVMAGRVPTMGPRPMVGRPGGLPMGPGGMAAGRAPVPGRSPVLPARLAR